MSDSLPISPSKIKKEIEKIEDEKKVEKLLYYFERLETAADRVDAELRRRGFLKD